MQMLTVDGRTAFSDQPFGLYTAPRAAINRLPLFEYGQVISPDEEEMWQIDDYVRALLAGELIVNGPWRFWSQGYPRRFDRVVLKVTDAKTIADHLCQTFDLTPVLMFRHPIAQALSVSRNGWRRTAPAFLRSSSFCERHLSSDQLAHAGDVQRSGGETEQRVLDWCLENVTLLAGLECDHVTVHYESLVSSPLASTQALASRLGLDASLGRMRNTLRQPSRSTRIGSTKSTRAAIEAGDRSRLIGRWLETVSDSVLRAVQETLDAFEVRVYRADSPLPVTIEPASPSDRALFSDG